MGCNCCINLVNYGNYSEHEIEYCPLHAAAPDMHKAINLALNETPWKPLGDDIKDVLRKAKAKAEGK